MSNELNPVVESEDAEDKSPQESSNERALVDLGLVSKDTKGFGLLGWDGGVGLRW